MPEVECEPSPDSTLVTHSYEMAFRGPFVARFTPTESRTTSDTPAEGFG